ncbi:unnamed protein product [Adineta steineri]|uniref:C2H2-type domain-containing protein n=1 Tax=Adineta steineri TaxID=433720 RepID=A0A815FBE3_9BILA|nr:unnamed protein product [Adineta steineri]
MDPRQWTCSQVIEWLSSFNKNKQVLDVFTRKPYYEFAELFKHIQYVHNGQLDFKVRCELGPLCGRVYSTFAGYKSHIYREHADLLNKDLYRKEMQITTDTHDDEILSATNYATQSVVNTQIYDGENEQDESERETETDDEDTIRWPLLTETIARSEGHCLPQNIIQTITSGLKSLIELIYQLLRMKNQKTTINSVTNDSILLTDVNEVISNITERITDITKNEHRFLKLCKKYFSYTPAKEIKLENPDQIAYYIPIECSIQQMLKKPDVLTMLIKNFNENVNRNIMDTDLMFNFRHGLLGKQHTVLKNKPDALLLQLYIDDIGLTNPIGAKKDTQKVTMIYFQLEDLPDTIKSMLNSIGVVAMCHSSYLTNKSNRKKCFDPIVEDLNALQTNGIFIPTLQTHLNFAFTVVTGDHLASNDIGGFQKFFNTGEFCRHCHINYDQKLVPLNEITHRRRTQDLHNNFVKQVINLNNAVTLHGVVGTSPLVNLIGFHAVTSLPNDPMHDFNEGVRGQLLTVMLKEASAKRLLTYGDIENRLLAFEYGDNDKSNKPPILRKKHLNKGKIVGTASQKMLFFKLFPIIFHDLIDQLETKEIYICLREIVNLVFACPFRKSWLSYLHSLCIRFQCLMVHLLPHMVTPKIHFVTDYAKQIEMNGPAIRHWCMRFESKHQIFKRLAVKSNNFKNILYTLSKRNQLHQCLLLSFSNYYTIVNEGYSVSERDLCTLPIDIREDIDGETLFNLPQSMMYEIIKPIKDRVRFLTEHHNLFDGAIKSQHSPVMFSSNTQGDGSVLGSTTTPDIIHEEIIISSKEDENKENDVDDEEPTLPSPYIIPDLPIRIQQIIDKGEIGEFRSHTYARRLLLDTIFNDVTTKYSLF